MIRAISWILVISLGFGSACSTLKRKEQISYSSWKPAILPQNVYEKFVSFLYLNSFDEHLFWVEVRPEEQGRSVIVKRNAEGIVTDVTPPTFSARSRVYEYGGPSYTVHQENLYFVNFQDQRVYWQDLNFLGTPVPLTPKRNADGSLGKYMDFVISPNGKWLVFVYEKEYDKKENQNFIGAINLEQQGPRGPLILASGADFYGAPSFSKDGTQLAWLQWNHPSMPWNSTELYRGSFRKGQVKRIKKLQEVGISL